LLGLSVLNVFDSDNLVSVVEQSRDVSAGLHRQIRARQDRFEKSRGGAVASTVFLCDLEVADALLRRSVGVLVVLQPGVLRGVNKGWGRGLEALQCAAFRSAAPAVNLARSALFFFGFFVVGQDVVVSPPFESEPAEGVVVAAMGGAVPHRVDRPRPAEDTAA